MSYFIWKKIQTRADKSDNKEVSIEPSDKKQVSIEPSSSHGPDLLESSEINPPGTDLIPERSKLCLIYELVNQVWISSSQIMWFHRWMPTTPPLDLGMMIICIWRGIHVSYIISPFLRSSYTPWSQRKRSVCIKAALAIISNYITLVQVNPRYISLFIMPVIMLVFIVALFIKASLKSSQKCNQDKNVDDVYITGCSEEISSHELQEDDISLFLTAGLPGFILCWIQANSGLVVSQFLLFLSSSIGELSMMLARLRPSQVAPAFEVIHRASLVLVLLTAHTMAAEALGDDAVLVCLPELVAALVWVTIYLGHDGSTTLRTVEAVLSKADNIPVQAICYAIVLAYLGPTMAELKDESDGATNLLSSYRDLFVICSFSVILLILLLFALRQCWGQTEAGPSSELEGAIQLLSFCRDILFRAGALCLVVYPLLVAPLRLQLQELAKDKWRNLVATEMTLF